MLYAIPLGQWIAALDCDRRADVCIETGRGGVEAVAAAPFFPKGYEIEVPHRY